MVSNWFLLNIRSMLLKVYNKFKPMNKNIICDQDTNKWVKYKIIGLKYQK